MEVEKLEDEKGPLGPTQNHQESGENVFYFNLEFNILPILIVIPFFLAKKKGITTNLFE